MAESTKTYSQKQEKLIASELGGYPVSGSGSRPCTPGDVKTYDWLIECKTHTKPDQSILFNIDVWRKISDEAMITHRKPVLVVDDGSQTVNKTWCLCRASNLDLHDILTVDYPIKIRKNLTGKHDKLAQGLKEVEDSLDDCFYQFAVYEVKFNNEQLIVLPFNTFKELFE